MRGEDVTANLSARCAASFDPRARERGLDYERNGRIKPGSVEDDAFSGAVRGTQRYAVLVQAGETRANSTELVVSCACPRFEDGYNCKHLYAVLVWLDHAGESLGVPHGLLNELRQRGIRLALTASGQR